MMTVLSAFCCIINISFIIIHITHCVTKHEGSRVEWKAAHTDHLHSLIMQASELIAQLLSIVWSELLTAALD
jgi:hypothetical protein